MLFNLNNQKRIKQYDTVLFKEFNYFRLLYLSIIIIIALSSFFLFIPTIFADSSQNKSSSSSIIIVNSTHINTLFTKALALYDLDRSDEALYYDKALAMDPTNVNAIKGKAAILAELGR